MISPIEVNFKNNKKKEFIDIINNSDEPYVFRTGISSSAVSNNRNKLSRYIVYPPVGIIKGGEKVQLGVIALDAKNYDFQDEYVYVHFAPKREKSSFLYEIPVNLTMLVKINA